MMTFPFVLLAPQYHMFDHQLVVLLEAIQYLLIIIIINLSIIMKGTEVLTLSAHYPYKRMTTLHPQLHS